MRAYLKSLQENVGKMQQSVAEMRRTFWLVQEAMPLIMLFALALFLISLHIVFS